MKLGGEIRRSGLMAGVIATCLFSGYFFQLTAGLFFLFPCRTRLDASNNACFYISSMPNFVASCDGDIVKVFFLIDIFIINFIFLFLLLL
jgi:hypothetical protein